MRFRIDIKTSKRHGTVHLKLRNLNKMRGCQQLYGCFSSLKNLESKLEAAVRVMEDEMATIKDDEL